MYVNNKLLFLIINLNNYNNPVLKQQFLFLVSNFCIKYSKVKNCCSLFLFRIVTILFFDSLSPTITIYGVLFKIAYLIFLLNLVSRRSHSILISISFKWYSICCEYSILSKVVGIITTCSGANQKGKIPW